MLRIHLVFHMSKLKRYTESNDLEFSSRIISPSSPIIVNDHEKFEVEKILDKKSR
jgi:hypothetical protein